MSLRERKYAATKATLMNGILTRLGQQSLDDIRVKHVCDAATVSEATFFNYFPSKQAAIAYRVQLWSIETIWQIQQQGGKPLDAIHTIFDTAAIAETKTPGVMREVIIYQAQRKTTFTPLSDAEYAYHFPKKKGINQIQAQGVNELFERHLAEAQRRGQIPGDVDLEALKITLMGIFFLTPIVAQGSLKTAYRRQLDNLL